MTSTVYTDLVGPAVNAAWLNDVNESVYSGTAPGGGAGASVTKYTPAGTGAVTTTVQAKLRESVSVKDFGAVGDGVADDTAAISAAIAYAKSVAFQEKEIQFPAGVYNVTKIDFTGVNYCTFRSNGASGVTITNANLSGATISGVVTYKTAT